MAWIEHTSTRSWRVRYRRDDGTTESISGFDSQKAAEDYAHMVDSDRRRGIWLDPSGLRTTLAVWVDRWLPTLDLDTRTLENYDSYLRNHILARFGTTPLSCITPLDIRVWTKDALDAGYAQTTVSGWLNLLSMILTDAVDQRLIPTNPVHKRRRRGRRSRKIQTEKIWATPEQVLRIATQAALLGGPIARLLIITAAWTGCRWGELTGLHRRNLDLRRGIITIDRLHAALHESRGKRWIGPPKTASSARRIPLPPFLVALLREHLASHPYEYVFTTPSGRWLWRSTFDRRVLRPAVDGNLHTANPTIRTYPVCPGLTFHGLRHSHNTWMIEDDTPEIARARRLGHHLDNRLTETYSHVSGTIQQRLLTNLEHRWHTSHTTHKPTVPTPRRRPHTTPAPAAVARDTIPSRNTRTTSTANSPHQTTRIGSHPHGQLGDSRSITRRRNKHPQPIVPSTIARQRRNKPTRVHSRQSGKPLSAQQK